MTERGIRVEGAGISEGSGEEGPQNALDGCEEVLTRLKKSTYAAPFLYPVDPQRLNIPDYYEKIKNPMDLSTIKKKLDKGEYGSAEEFRSDVMLMLSNCYSYNQPDSAVYKMGTGLEKYFRQLLQRGTVKNLGSAEKRVKREGSPERRKAKTQAAMAESDRLLCFEVLTEIMKPKYRRFNWPFLEPVDGALIPDYYVLIKRPMDLSTMKGKLSGGQYASVEEFVADFDLMISNCYTFNAEGSEVYICASKLSAQFRSTLEQRKKKGQAAPSGVPAAPDSVQRRIAELRSLIAQQEAELHRLERRAGGGQSPAQFSYEEKRKLKKRIEALPVESLRGVVEFLQKSVPSAALTSADELEVNLDCLDQATLVKLSDLSREVCTNGPARDDSDSSSE